MSTGWFELKSLRRPFRRPRPSVCGPRSNPQPFGAYWGDRSPEAGLGVAGAADRDSRRPAEVQEAVPATKLDHFWLIRRIGRDQSLKKNDLTNSIQICTVLSVVEINWKSASYLLDCMGQKLSTALLVLPGRGVGHYTWLNCRTVTALSQFRFHILFITPNQCYVLFY